MLTKRQKEVYDFILAYWEAHEKLSSPTYDEIVAGTSLRSKSHAFRTVDILASKGFIYKVANRARALEPTPDPTERQENRDWIEFERRKAVAVDTALAKQKACFREDPSRIWED